MLLVLLYYFPFYHNILSKKPKSFLVEYEKIKKNIEEHKQKINNNKVTFNNLFDNKLKDVITLIENLEEKNTGLNFVYLLIKMINDEAMIIKFKLEEDYLKNKFKLQEYELKIYNILEGNIEEIDKLSKFNLKMKNHTKLINFIDCFIMILYLFIEVIDYRDKILERGLEGNKIKLLREFLTFNIHQEEKNSLVLFISIIVKRAMIQILFESDETLKSGNTDKKINTHNYQILMLLKFVARKVKDKMTFYSWVNKHYQLLSEKSFDYANAIDIRRRDKSTELENFMQYRSKDREPIYQAEIVSHTVIELEDSSNLNSYVVLIDNNDRKYIDIVYHNEKIFKVSEVVELIYRRTRNSQFIFEIISEPVVKLELDELEMFWTDFDGVYKNRPKEYL